MKAAIYYSPTINTIMLVYVDKFGTLRHTYERHSGFKITNNHNTEMLRLRYELIGYTDL